MSIKNFDPGVRPREKAERGGVASLSEAELLALLLGSGGAEGRTAVDLANALLGRYGSLYGLSRATLPDLLLVKGIGKAKALSIVSAFEMAKRASEEALKAPSFSPSHVHSLIKEGVSEAVFLFRYDERGRYLGHERIANGNADRVKQRVGPLLARVFKSGATSFALAHNHPSGELRPSKEDFVATGILLSRSQEMDLLFLDHLIVGPEGYYSFREHGLIVSKLPSP